MPKISWNGNESLENNEDREYLSANDDNNDVRTIIKIDPRKTTFHSNWKSKEAQYMPH